jgi:hypothetical protein
MRTTPTSPGNGAARAGAPVVDPPARLDDLLPLDAAQLGVLYAAAATPRLPDLSGDLRGRLLAWAGVPRAMGAVFRAMQRSDHFPWRGKTFRHDSDSQGDGDNRLFADRFHRYRFLTSIGPSRSGSGDAVQLEYDLAENPFFVRALHDEIRELRPGLYLGQGYLMRPGAPRLLLYFGLER